MGYEKEKRIEQVENKKRLASSIKGDSKQPLNFDAREASSDALSSVSTVFQQLLYAVADGDVAYFTVGRSRDGGSVLLTVTDDRGVKSYAGGNNYEKFARECDALFE